MEGGPWVYPGNGLARLPNDRQTMMSASSPTHTLPRLRESRVLRAIVSWCALVGLTVGFPVWSAARLAAHLAFPSRRWRSLRAPMRRGPSARRDAFTALPDQSRLRSLSVTTGDALVPSPERRRAAHRPDALRSITRHRLKTSFADRGFGRTSRTPHAATLLSHGRALLGESLRREQPAGPHEARNSHQCEPARNAGRDPRGRPTRGAPRRPSRSPADGWRHLPR